MRATNLTSPDGTGSWGGLAFDVDAPTRPELRMEVATGRRMLLRQGDRPLLFARIADGYHGVDLLRADGVRSPVAPCRADRARALAEFGPIEAVARWAHTFAGELAGAAEGPLHTGRWILSRHDAGERSQHLRPSERWSLPAGDHDGYLNWFTTPSDRDIVPLRALSPLDSARVKAYRKQARNGALPPILLWWMSGLCCHVLLDGHDRFVPPWPKTGSLRCWSSRCEVMSGRRARAEAGRFGIMPRPWPRRRAGSRRGRPTLSPGSSR